MKKVKFKIYAIFYPEFQARFRLVSELAKARLGSARQKVGSGASLIFMLLAIGLIIRK